jgi:hypothetical protein
VAGPGTLLAVVTEIVVQNKQSCHQIDRVVVEVVKQLLVVEVVVKQLLVVVVVVEQLEQDKEQDMVVGLDMVVQPELVVELERVV